MNFTIKKLSDDCDTKIRVRNFLFSQIRSEYGYGYIPSWHKDIVDLNKYYIDCRKNNLFFVENNDDGRIIASMAIRHTASIWRSFVEKPYRRCGLATHLFDVVEEFCYENDFNEIYLHTQKNLVAGFNFWKKVGFQVTLDTNNELKTVHMVKNLCGK